MSTLNDTPIDVRELDGKVQRMYTDVAEHPDGTFHFETGRAVAERLGYPEDLLDAIPQEALASFAGVGWFLDLADLRGGERVVDFGSGSGTDSFAAAHLVGPTGRVRGLEYTDAQLAKASRLATEVGATQLDFTAGRIERAPFGDNTADCVISNGVINLIVDKQAVIAEAARLLRPGGRLAIADIVTEQPLTDTIVRNADLWASCVGGAAQQDDYLRMIERSGLEVQHTRVNDYGFLSDQARGASRTYGVKSVSVLAVKPQQ
ncbi:methyltransferase domain-containing protein [Demequina sp. SO4-13]|uniref:methyltransferase domain-containing protein n=1 Tax=Demequina sp. SO4-13 TaxID=3401027 RepID=UPI003AF827EC